MPSNTVCAASSTVSTTTLATVPALKLTNATPPRDSSPQTVGLQKSATPRLLYRGALALPDSHLLLDGLTFTIDLPSDDPHASRTLLETPLPLELESMRGRPSLRFVGIEKMENVHCDFSGNVSLHVHPRSILTRQLFMYSLCAQTISHPKGHTDVGVRIRLGDSDMSGAPSASGAATVNTANDIIVYGRPHASSSVLQLCVARIVPAPMAPALPKGVAKLRPPRPDDPTPRKPPVGFGIARIGLGVKRAGKDKDVGEEAAPRKKQKKEAPVVDAIVKDLGKNSRIGKTSDAGAFKVPQPPVKGKGKATVSDVFDLTAGDESGSDLENRNKLFIKKATVRLMSAAGIGKQHPDFKDFFNHVYRGTAFALRTKVKITAIDTDQKEGELVDRIVQAHITMYLGGQGLGVFLLQ